MRIGKAMLAVVLSLAASSMFGCSPAQETAREQPARFFWSGDLIELDGAAVGSTGVKLEIEQAASAPNSEFVYHIATGCMAAGIVNADGEVSSAEVLRPCLPADIERVGRLNHISGGPLTADPSPVARLTWTEDAAVLTSDRGTARFSKVR